MRAADREPEHPGWRYSRLATGTAVALVVVLLAAAVVVAVVKSSPCDGGLSATDDDQCIGLSDGSAVLSPEITDILARIRDENASIQGAAVTVAVLAPLPRPGTDPDYTTSLRHDLEGAHIAQLAANHTHQFGDIPPVRLVVANSGDGSAHQQDVVPQIIDQRPDGGAGQRLVGVIATGRSLVDTDHAVDALVGAGIPIVSARLTADELGSAPPSPTLPIVRVAPSNREQAAAAATLLKPETATAMLVQDINPQDTYTSSLGAAFAASYVDPAHRLVGRTANYNGALPGVSNTMGGIAADICARHPDVVYLAGRTAALEALVDALPTRSCSDVPIRIVTGSDAAAFATALRRGEPGLREALGSGITVSFTNLASPDAWSAVPDAFLPAAVAPLRGPCQDAYCFGRVFPNDSLADGAVIIGFDSMLSMVRAVRTGFGINDSPQLVTQYLPRMHDTAAVPGASGYISWDAVGEAVNKAVPVIVVDPTGTVRFDRLSSTTGTPCIPDRSEC